MTQPPRAVAAAFGIDEDPVALPGGEGVTYRASDIVLKRVHDPDESAWTQALLSRVEQDGFRIPEPLPDRNGGWVHENWTATRFLPGLRPAAPRWHDIIDAGLRFCDAAEVVREGGHDVLSARTHRWAIADRVAWNEVNAELSSSAAGLVESIRALLSGEVRHDQFVHGDLTGNVMLDADDTPVILDVSPYLRPRGFAAAIVIADAVVWNDADLALAQAFVQSPDDRDLFGRALIFRLVAEQLADDPRHRAVLDPYRRVLAAIRSS